MKNFSTCEVLEALKNFDNRLQGLTLHHKIQDLTIMMVKVSENIVEQDVFLKYHVPAKVTFIPNIRMVT